MTYFETPTADAPAASATPDALPYVAEGEWYELKAGGRHAQVSARREGFGLDARTYQTMVCECGYRWSLPNCAGTLTTKTFRDHVAGGCL